MRKYFSTSAQFHPPCYRCGWIKLVNSRKRVKSAQLGFLHRHSSHWSSASGLLVEFSTTGQRRKSTSEELQGDAFWYLWWSLTIYIARSLSTQPRMYPEVDVTFERVPLTLAFSRLAHARTHARILFYLCNHCSSIVRDKFRVAKLSETAVYTYIVLLETPTIVRWAAPFSLFRYVPFLSPSLFRCFSSLILHPRLLSLYLGYSSSKQWGMPRGRLLKCFARRFASEIADFSTSRSFPQLPDACWLRAWGTYPSFPVAVPSCY